MPDTDGLPGEMYPIPDSDSSPVDDGINRSTTCPRCGAARWFAFSGATHYPDDCREVAALRAALRDTNEQIIRYGTSPDTYDWADMTARTRANAKLIGDDRG